MLQLIVKAKRLNKRKVIPAFLPDPNNIVGVVNENFVFEGDEVGELDLPNKALGKWYKDRDGHFYWGGGLGEKEEVLAKDFKAAVIFPWWIENALYSIPELWNEKSSKKVTIAILDTGINEHFDFDFSKINGFNYLENNESYKTDGHGHGTHLAGIIAAQGKKSFGVNPTVDLFIAKVSDSSNTLSLKAVRDCLSDILNQKNGAIDIDVINMSFQITVGIDPEEIKLKQEIEDLLRKLHNNNNCILVSAVGNINRVKNFFPASMEECISVGNINSELKRNPNSTMSPSLDIMAPGTEIVSLKGVDELGVLSGSSQSCAFVSAVCSKGIQELKEFLLSDNKMLIKHLLHTAFNNSFPLLEYGSGIVSPNQFIKSIKTIAR